jgi:acetone carboxylase alpha subunit
MPTKQWLTKERQKILAKDASVQVRHMYASSFALSEKFTNEFMEFWNLPNKWKLTEEELEIPIFGAKINKNS